VIVRSCASSDPTSICGQQIAQISEVVSLISDGAGQNGRGRRSGLIGERPEAERLSMVGVSRRVSGSKRSGDALTGA
jgi:hypothetical protein